MKKNFQSKMRSALDADSRDARISDTSRFAGQVLDAAPHAPRDIAKPFAGMAREIELGHIRPDPKQPRKTMSDDGLRDLAESIKENGVLQPITVTWSEGDSCYLIVTGQRRFEASKLAGLPTIPAIIRPETYDEQKRLQQQLVENIQREGIPAPEEALAIKQLMETLGLSARDVAKRLGKPFTYVQEILSVLKLPPERLERAETLPKRAVVEIAKAKDDEEQEHLLKVGLSAQKPYQAVREARRERSTPKPKRTTRTYNAPEHKATVTVTFAKSPERVSDQLVVEALTAVVQKIAGAKVKSLTKLRRRTPDRNAVSPR